MIVWYFYHIYSTALCDDSVDVPRLTDLTDLSCLQWQGIYVLRTFNPLQSTMPAYYIFLFMKVGLYALYLREN